MTHHFRLQVSPFTRIQNGTKTFEIRLNDEKRRKVQIGDEIIFTLMSDPTQSLTTTVTNLIHAQTFRDLYEQLPLKLLDKNDKNSWTDLYKYYSKEDEALFGVVGIQITVTDSTTSPKMK